MIIQTTLTIPTSGRGLINITDDIAAFVTKAAMTIGLCHVFIHHTSASLTLCENADPLVQSDLEAFMQRLIPDGDAIFQHTAEGLDDMPSHVRAILTQSFLMIPIAEKKLVLGTWQGIYLWEHRLRRYQRTLTITIQGE